MDCVVLCEHRVDDLNDFLTSWLHVLPSGLAALLRLRDMPFNFSVSKIVSQRKGLAAHGSMKSCLQVNCHSSDANLRESDSGIEGAVF